MTDKLIERRAEVWTKDGEEIHVLVDLMCEYRYRIRDGQQWAQAYSLFWLLNTGWALEQE